jgi:predicted Fe-Mo cluster-binding NifX family protein
MKICIPTDDAEGLDARVSRQLGSAPFLTLVDTEDDSCSVLRNPEHGNRSCTAAAPLEGTDVETLVCRGAGKRAVASLHRAGIRVMLTTARSVHDAVQVARDGGLRELSVAEARGEGSGRGRGRNAGGGRGPGAGYRRRIDAAVTVAPGEAREPIVEDSRGGDLGPGRGGGRGPGAATRARHRHRGRSGRL